MYIKQFSKFLILFMVCILLSNFSIEMVSAEEINKDYLSDSENVTNENVDVVYELFLKNFPLNDNEVAQYTIWDINYDNVSELMISIKNTTTDAGNVEVYTRNGSEIIKVECPDEIKIGTTVEGNTCELRCSRNGVVNIISNSDSEIFEYYRYKLTDDVNNLKIDESSDDLGEFDKVKSRYISPKWYELNDISAFDSYRLLAEETASFLNSFIGIYGLDNLDKRQEFDYSLSDISLQSKLEENIDKSILNKYQTKVWDQVCYGICVTTVLVNLDMLDIQEIDPNINTFSGLNPLSESKETATKIRDILNYYQIIQADPEIDDIEIQVHRYKVLYRLKRFFNIDDDSLKTFLKDLVERSKSIDSKGAIVFGFRWYENENILSFESLGHEMIINSCTGGENEADYELEIIDPNFEFAKMVILSDYSSFYFVTKEDEIHNEYSEVFEELSYYDSMDVFEKYK